MIDFLLKAFELKDEVRAGWKLRGIRDPESVADHSWGTALLCWLFGTATGIDRERAMAMSLLHDIAEAEMGDVATRVHEEERSMTPEEKRRREADAFATVRALLDVGGASQADRAPEPESADGPVHGPAASEMTELWQEYEHGESLTAQFVRDMNLCDMCLQALLYQRATRYDEKASASAFAHFERLDEFFETSRPRLSTEVGRKLFSEIEARYRAS